MDTGVVYISTCFAGGKNINLLKMSDTGITFSHNFILIVGSATDAPTYVENEQEKFYLHYYNFSAFLQDKGTSLNKLLQEINTLNMHTDSPHGTSNIPQVWLPGGLGFQTFNIDERLFILGNVLVRVHEDEKKPITISDKQAVLVYPQSIKVPVIVKPRVYTSEDFISRYEHPF